MALNPDEEQIEQAEKDLVAAEAEVAEARQALRAAEARMHAAARVRHEADCTLTRLRVESEAKG